MFIYAKNEKVKEALLQAGFKLITAQEQKSEEKMWVFEYNSEIALPDFEDKSAMFMSKKMSF
jgi:hypothetical protein